MSVYLPLFPSLYTFSMGRDDKQGRDRGKAAVLEEQAEEKGNCFQLE